MFADNPRLKKFVTIAIVLGVAQIIAIFLMSSKKPPLPVRAAIEKAISDVSNVDSQRKELLRVQLALADFIAKNNGNPPASLNQLIPVYFDTLPIDPSTNKPYQYKVEGKRYIIGDPEKYASKKTSTSTDPSQPAQPPKAGGTASSDQKEALLKSLKDDAPALPAYDPGPKKDPFRPFDIAPKSDRSINRSPMESHPLDQFSYAAYLQSAGEPKALLETPDGKGYTAIKGAKIGSNSGEITEITPEKVVVVESEIDFTGQRQTKTIEIPLGVKRGIDPKAGKGKVKK